ncbi:tripartite tricarboxylate transporter substrate-binding protein [Cupriavidus sp. MP-37]|uniref:tripartite tricarboxylate transporter substrate-binding protein n=1 Tax=Cupriavidus sp. MP-37 TaxID=2884455 RepID=UPI001D0B4B2F|nr:tripartite tricarboxylate transporter substrate-binding protein [Cupriavidus sp. MP-37]UDM49164.1 ABC transporter substrate-binding protein [Cupriavidus sp. MP-37]
MSSKVKRIGRRRIIRGLAAAGLAVGLCVTQSAYAEAPARFIVPFPAGGAADAMARVLVEKLRGELKQTVIVENRPGASTRVAAEVLKQAPQDGNTVLMTLHDTMVIAPLVYSNLRYDPDKDFSPITEVAALNYGLAVSASSPYKTLADYVKAAKADRNVATVGVSGLGSALHFVAFEFTRRSGGDFSIVPFQGGPAMVTNLVGNQIGSAVDGLGVFVEQHRANKVRVLAVSGKQRSSQLPDVPTFSEQGYASLVVGSGYALYAPAGTPPAQVSRWNAAMRKVLAMPDVRSRIQNIGYEPLAGSTPQEVTQLRKRLVEFWTPIVQTVGFRGD